MALSVPHLFCRLRRILRTKAGSSYSTSSVQQMLPAEMPPIEEMPMEKLTFRPRLVFWELTKGCNLRCIHCRASATEVCSPDDLSTESCSPIIDQLAEVAPFILVLS